MVGFKNRYLVMEMFVDPNKEFSVEDPIVITQFNVSKAIKDSILLNFGECGLASSLFSFQVKYVNPITKLCIIRASREEYQKVWSAITMVRSVGNCPVMLNLLDLSGRTDHHDFLLKDLGNFGLAILPRNEYLLPAGNTNWTRTQGSLLGAVAAGLLLAPVFLKCLHIRSPGLLGSIKACKNAALKCDESKFAHYKLVAGARLTADVTQQMQNCLAKIKVLEH